MKFDVTRRGLRLTLLALAITKRSGLLGDPAFAEELRRASAAGGLPEDFVEQLSVAEVDALASKLIAQAEGRPSLLDRLLGWFGGRPR